MADFDDPANDSSAMSRRARPAHPSALQVAEQFESAFGKSVLAGADCEAYAVCGQVPAVVTRPESAQEVCEVLATASELGASVVPWGSGSRMVVGLPPSHVDIVLSMERLNRVLEYDPADLTVSVQAGITHAGLAGMLSKQGQILPLDVPLPGRATLGGTLATATTGLRRSFFGGPRDVVLGLKAADARGTLLNTGGRVVKNVTGYDMSKVFIGSLGTLCVIVETHLKLTPQPEAEGTVLGIYARPDEALAAAEALDALGVQPSTLAMVQVGAIHELASLAPGHLDHTLLVARYPGVASAVARALREGEGELARRGARTTLRIEGEAETVFWATVDDYPAYTSSNATGAFFRVYGQPATCADLIETIVRKGAESTCEVTWLADALAGTVWFRVFPRSGHVDTEASAALNDTVVSIIEVLAQRERMPTILAAPRTVAERLNSFLPDSPTRAIMRELKQRFDPDETLNPGRIASLG